MKTSHTFEVYFETPEVTITITGASCAGKTTIAELIYEYLRDEDFHVVLSSDSKRDSLFKLIGEKTQALVDKDILVRINDGPAGSPFLTTIIEGG